MICNRTSSPEQAGEVDLSIAIARIERRLEDIVRPTLQIRSSLKRLMLRVAILEGQVRRLQ